MLGSVDERPREVAQQRRTFRLLTQRTDGIHREALAHRVGLALPHRRRDVLVARAPEAVLGAEVVHDQGGRHVGGAGDRADARADHAGVGEARDGRVPDAGARGQVGVAARRGVGGRSIGGN
ncbi:MAG: hypothetical protein WD010_06610 [Nitriliruptor sp.]